VILDINSIELPDIVKTDICIIGAGPAGISLASRISKLNVSLDICLIESGGLQLEYDTQNLYSGESIGQSYFPLISNRLRYFGGSTGHWNGWCAELNSFDFENRKWIKNSGWQ